MAGTPKLIVLSEQLRGQSFELTEAEYTVGRTDECDISLPDPTVSSHHCTLIQLDDGGYGVDDKGSTNGTRVNGVRLEAANIQPLANSDILQVGGVEMLFDCEEARSVGTSTTHTVINLEETQTGELAVAEMKNFSPFGSRGAGVGRQDKKGALMVGAIIGGLVVAVLVALAVVAFKLMSGGS